MSHAPLSRVMTLRDVVLFTITAIVGLRWLTTAASQFGLASCSCGSSPSCSLGSGGGSPGAV